MKFAFCVIIIIAAVLAPTLMLTEPVLAGAQSKPATAIKKKGEACPANTNDCNPQSWCCVKPSICVRGGCTQPR